MASTTLFTKSDLDLFEKTPIQSAIKTSKTVSFLPVNSLQNSTVREYRILSSINVYNDISTLFEKLTLHITKENGTDINNTDIVAPCNMIGYTCNSKVDLSLNGTLVNSAADNYAYLSYFTNLLHAGEAIDNRLTSSLTYLDSAGQFDNVTVGDPAPTVAETAAEGVAVAADAARAVVQRILRNEKRDKNTGFIKRASYFQNNNRVEVIAQILTDLTFTSPKLLISGVDIELAMYTNPSSFSLICSGAEKYNIEIVKSELFIKQYTPYDEIITSQAKTLMSYPVRYPIRRHVFSRYIIPAGNHSFSKDGLFPTPPDFILMGVILNEALIGRYNKNPFNFQHHSMKTVSLIAGGKTYGGRPLRIDVDKNIYVESYANLCIGLSKFYGNTALKHIDIDTYKKGGYFLLAFDLTSDNSSFDDHISLQESTDLRLEIEFGTAPIKALTVLLMGMFKSEILINHNREVIKSYEN